METPEGMTSEGRKELDAQVKREKFDRNPEDFFHKDDIILMALKLPDAGMAILSGNCKRTEIEVALTRMTYKSFMMFQAMDMERAMGEKKSEIITNPVHGGNGMHRKPIIK